MSLGKIEENGSVITEAEQSMAMFPIISSFKADKITVFYTPSEAGDFLGGGLIDGITTSIELDFADGTTAILPVPIANDDVNEPDGSITIKLEDDEKVENGQPVITYSIDESLVNSGTVNVVDDDSLPVVSIVLNSGDVAENAGPAKFMLTATGLSRATSLMINATPAEDGSDYLMDTIAETADEFSVEFSDLDGDSIFTGELSVNLDNDETGEATGDIKLTLNADSDTVKTYQLGENSEGVITILDDDAPELSIVSVNESIDEADNVFAEFRISARVSPDDNVKIYYDLVETGSVLKNNDILNTGTRKTVELDFTNEKTEETLSIEIDNDDNDEKNSTITVTLIKDTAPISYTVASSPNNSAEIEVIDDDYTPQIKLSTSTPNIEEGESAIFILTATPEDSFTQGQKISVEFNVEQEGDFLMWRVARTFIMGSSEESFTINTRDDSIDTEDGSVTLRLVESNNYVISDDNNYAIVNISDNDTVDPNDPQETQPEDRIAVAEVAVNEILSEILDVVNNLAPAESETPSPVNPKIPTVSIDSIHSQVEEGGSAEFNINANGGSEIAATNIKMSVNPVGDFFEFNEPQRISRQILGQGLVRVVFPTIDDTLAEADGRLEVSIIPDSSYRIAATKGSTTVIVSDAVDRQVRQDLLTASSQAFLPDVVGNMTVRTTDLISQRVKQGFNEFNNISLNLGGQNSLRGLIEMSGEMANKGLIDWREVLGDSSFTMTLLTGENFVAPTTIWGVGDNRGLSSSSSSQAWSGDVFTGQFGIDALINQEFLTGLSASIVENEIELDSESIDGLDFALNSTTLTPYFGWNSPTQNAELQAIASYGIGEFSINQTDYEFETLASRSFSFALSGRKELYASDSILNGVTKLNIISDSWFASNYIEGQADLLADMQTDAHYLRLRTEGTHQFSFARGSSLTPLISVGIRDDRKDQLTNFGMELTSGFDYTDPIGLNLSGTGNMLYAGENTIQKMSLNGTLEYDYGNDDLGFTFGISPTWGQTLASVQNSIWSSSILASDQEVGQYSEGTQISTNIGYGFSLGEESRKLNLYSSYEFDAEASNKLLLGTSVSVGSNLSFNLERNGVLNSQDLDAAKYQLNGSLSW